jgi:hypothetical protein
MGYHGMKWSVKPKTQIFEGLGWYLALERPLGVESMRTINERGKNVVRPVNKALTIYEPGQPLVVPDPPCSETVGATTAG